MGIVRGAGFAQRVIDQHRIYDSPNFSLISVVSKGEIYSLARQFQWRRQKMDALEAIIGQIPSVDISDEKILIRYAEIDAFSQGRDLSRSLGSSSRNMGKNDLWIAATASVLNAHLVTTDQDFNHLDTTFLKLIRVSA